MGGLVVFLIVAFIFVSVVQWVRTGSLRGRIEALEREIARLKNGECAAPELWTVPAERSAPQNDAARATPADNAAETAAAFYPVSADIAAARAAPADNAAGAAAAFSPVSADIDAAAAAVAPGDRTAGTEPPALLRHLSAFIKSGNYWAAGGIVFLLAGFATLIAYLARRGFFTLEMGIASAVLTGLGMLAAGWVFRNRRRVYCLLLQGGGIGMLYLSVFAAHRLTPWFSPLTALILLSLLVAPAVILALFQGSELLAVFGFFGGFAAPLLVSSGDGGHVFLFSYYTVLSLGVFTIGLFRFWRGLNLLAFLCTFGSALWWVSAAYGPEMFWSAEPFFIGYLLIFTILGIHGFGKKVFQRDAYFDTTLLLGSPALGAILQWRVFSFIEHGHALVSLVFAAFYLALAILIWKRKGAVMRLFAEAYLGLAALLANLAVPLELAPGITSAIWAAEGVLFFFFGLRLKNGKATLAALGLHFAAAIAFAADRTVRSGEAVLFRSPNFTGSALIALAALALIIIARKLREQTNGGAADAAGNFFPPGIYHPGFFIAAVWFYAWWFGGWLNEFSRVLPDYWGVFFIFCSATALGGFAAARFLRCPALLLGIIPSLVCALCVMLGVIFENALDYFGGGPWFVLSRNFFQGPYRWGWPVFFAVQAAIAGLGKKDVRDEIRWSALFAVVLIAAVILSSSGRALTLHFNLAPAWRSFAGLLPLFAAIIITGYARRRTGPRALGPLGGKLMFFVLPLIFSGVLGLWFVATLFLSGDPAPVPVYIPILNPLDLLEAFSIMLFLFWQSGLRKTKEALGNTALFAITDTALFLFITALVARSLHFYAGIPYEKLAGSDAFQLGLLVSWAFYGVAHIIAGTRLARRGIWIAGAALTVLDVAKLLILDMAGSGTPARIISFFASGLVLLFIGWVSPLPPAHQDQNAAGKDQPE
jgi:uncharacterized membrane protein